MNKEIFLYNHNKIIKIQKLHHLLLLSNPQTSVLSIVLKTSFTAKGSVQIQALTCHVSRLPLSATVFRLSASFMSLTLVKVTSQSCYPMPLI